MTKPVEVYQIAYRVNREWKYSEFKMTCEQAEEAFVAYEWRVVPNSGELRRPGESLAVPVKASERGQIKRWSREELDAFYRGPVEPIRRRVEAEPDDDDYRVVRDEDECWWESNAPALVTRTRLARQNRSSRL
jgi:hypothetical protein